SAGVGFSSRAGSAGVIFSERGERGCSSVGPTTGSSSRTSSSCGGGAAERRGGASFGAGGGGVGEGGVRWAVGGGAGGGGRGRGGGLVDPQGAVCRDGDRLRALRADGRLPGPDLERLEDLAAVGAAVPEHPRLPGGAATA